MFTIESKPAVASGGGGGGWVPCRLKHPSICTHRPTPAALVSASHAVCTDNNNLSCLSNLTNRSITSSHSHILSPSRSTSVPLPLDFSTSTILAGMADVGIVTQFVPSVPDLPALTINDDPHLNIPGSISALAPLYRAILGRKRSLLAARDDRPLTGGGGMKFQRLLSPTAGTPEEEPLYTRKRKFHSLPHDAPTPKRLAGQSIATRTTHAVVTLNSTATMPSPPSPDMTTTVVLSVAPTPRGVHHILPLLSQHVVLSVAPTPRGVHHILPLLSQHVCSVSHSSVGLPSTHSDLNVSRNITPTSILHTLPNVSCFLGASASFSRFATGGGLEVEGPGPELVPSPLNQERCHTVGSPGTREGLPPLGRPGWEC